MPSVSFGWEALQQKTRANSRVRWKEKSERASKPYSFVPQNDSDHVFTRAYMAIDTGCSNRKGDIRKGDKLSVCNDPYHRFGNLNRARRPVSCVTFQIISITPREPRIDVWLCDDDYIELANQELILSRKQASD